jgi:hypothetical protein
VRQRQRQGGSDVWGAKGVPRCSRWWRRPWGGSLRGCPRLCGTNSSKHAVPGEETTTSLVNGILYLVVEEAARSSRSRAVTRQDTKGAGWWRPGVSNATGYNLHLDAAGGRASSAECLLSPRQPPEQCRRRSCGAGWGRSRQEGPGGDVVGWGANYGRRRCSCHTVTGSGELLAAIHVIPPSSVMWHHVRLHPSGHCRTGVHVVEELGFEAHACTALNFLKGRGWVLAQAYRGRANSDVPCAFICLVGYLLERTDLPASNGEVSECSRAGLMQFRAMVCQVAQRSVGRVPGRDSPAGSFMGL